MSEGNIRCPASRRGRSWVAHAPEHGAYGHGRTLAAARASITQGLALLGVTAEVTLIPVTPELETLRSAQDAYTAALSDAVAALALRRVPVGDIAAATGAPAKRVRLLLAEQAHHAPPTGDLEPTQDDAAVDHRGPAQDPPAEPAPAQQHSPGDLEIVGEPAEASTLPRRSNPDPAGASGTQSPARRRPRVAGALGRDGRAARRPSAGRPSEAT